MISKFKLKYTKNSWLQVGLKLGGVRGFLAGYWRKLVLETRYRLSGSLTFSLMIHVLLISSYFGLSSLERPVEPPIREINFVDLTEVIPEEPKVQPEKEKRYQYRPKIVPDQPPESPQVQTNVTKQQSSPIVLGNDRIFLDKQRKQAPINLDKIAAVAGNVNQPDDILKVSQAIGIKKDERLSKPSPKDLTANNKSLLASMPQQQGAVSFDRSGKAEIDLQSSQDGIPVSSAVTDLNQPNPEPKKTQPKLQIKETQTIITGDLANRKIIKKILPPFPLWAKRQGVGATIALRFTVMENGTVKENVIVERTSGSREWDKMVITALKGWKFVALQKTGIRKDQNGVVTFQFLI
jgi:TonB family protein